MSRLIDLVDRALLCVVNTALSIQNRRLVKLCRSCNKVTPNIANPHLYVDLMLWRKVVDRNPLYVLFSDKLRTKDYLRECCPELKIPETLWQGTELREIPRESFDTGDTWLKANNGSSYNRFCPRGEPDLVALETVATTWLRSIYGRKKGEWTYALVEPRLLLERSIARPGVPLVEFQLRSSNGNVWLGSVMGLAKTKSQWHYYVDPQGQPLCEPVALPEHEADVVPMSEVREAFLQAVEYSKVLSLGTDYVRCDFFWNGETLYGGEITIFPNGGYRALLSPKWDCLARSNWDIRQSHFMTTPQRGWRKCYQAALARQWKPPQFSQE
jgi:hypothetical protein